MVPIQNEFKTTKTVIVRDDNLCDNLTYPNRGVDEKIHTSRAIFKAIQVYIISIY